jgi:superfamily II DNA/RNA helicase
LNFSDLNLTPLLQQTVADMGLYAPTPIQAQAIPPALQGSDVWATAPTGSGKTLAFALPMVQMHLLQTRQTNFRRPIRSLVLVPTRELAVQVGDVLTHLSYKPGLKVAVVFGGVSINPQMMGLRGGADILIATPGRLLDLADHNAISLKDVQHLVLDEADRLLDLGFADELQRVLALLPARRQTLLFSATFAPEVEMLAVSLLRDPVRITVEAFEGHQPDISQRAIAVDEKKRTALLRHLIAEHGWKQVLVFVATRYACEHVANKLCQAGINAAPFHGEMSQGARQDVLRDFKTGRCDVMVTTDLASRGIDIAMLPVVINYDLPRSATDYTHRIGRTGRAGAHGDAVSFVTAHALAHWKLIQKRESLALDLEKVTGFEPVDEPPAPQGNGGIKGKRPSKKDKLRAAARLG